MRTTIQHSILIVGFVFLFSQISNAGAIESVTNTNDTGPGSLRSAVQLVDPGGVILFSNAILNEVIRLTSGAIQINKNITILGPGHQRLKITSENQSRIFIQGQNTLFTLIGIHLTDARVRWGTIDALNRGGVIFSQGTLVLDNCVISNGTATYGGGIHGDTVIIEKSNIIDNKAFLEGGGVLAKHIVVSNSTFTNNQATGRYETVRLGTIFRKGNGGGICGGHSLSINQCTIVENASSGMGGGIYWFNSSVTHTLEMTSTSLNNNSAEIGGGLFEEFSNIGKFMNNIIGNNIASGIAPDVFIGGAWTDPGSVKNNIISILDDTATFPGSNNQIGSFSMPLNPMLDTLKDNGGPTLTSALLECSPAIDSGEDPDISSLDQRGFARSVGKSIDVGPYEYEDPYGQECYYGNFENYVIIGRDKVEISDNSAVLSGGIGILTENGEASIQNNSSVSGPSTFVKAHSISITVGSTVDNPIYETPDLILPDHLNHTYTAGSNLKVASNQVLIITDSIFKDIEIEKGATVTFTSPNIYCKNFKVDENVKVIVNPCTKLIITDLFDLGKNNQVNVENNGLIIYSKHAHIDEGNVVTAHMYVNTHLRVKGSSSRPTLLKGQQIGNEITADDHVTFDWNTSDPCTPLAPPEYSPCESLTVDAGIDKGVIFSDRFTSLKDFSCVLLNATVYGGSPPYNISWSPSYGLNDSTFLRPAACPRVSTTYYLTIVDSQGCVKTDSTVIEAYEVSDLQGEYGCSSNSLKIAICDLETNTTICGNIMSSSEENGIGPNLNIGNSLGFCDNLGVVSVTKVLQKKAPNTESLVWPNPTSGILNLQLNSSFSDVLSIDIIHSSGTPLEVDWNRIIIRKGTKLIIKLHPKLAGLYYYSVRYQDHSLDNGKFVVIR